MATLKINLPKEFQDKLDRLGNKTDDIVINVLEAGGEVVLKAVRDNLQEVIGKETKVESRSTGELAGALGLSPVKINRRGNPDIKIGFHEPRSDGGVNAKIATVLEYGKHGQPAKPFIAPARKSSRKAAVQAMEEAFFQEVEKV